MEWATIHGIDSGIVFFTLSDVLCVRWNEWNANTVLHSSVLYCIKRGGWKRKTLENLQSSTQRTDNQRIQPLRPLYPLWILEGAGQLWFHYKRKRKEWKDRSNRQNLEHSSTGNIQENGFIGHGSREGISIQETS